MTVAQPPELSDADRRELDRIAAAVCAAHPGALEVGSDHRVAGNCWVGEFELTVGIINDDAYTVFRQGQCHALALAMWERTGWQIIGEIRRDCYVDVDCDRSWQIDGLCGCQVVHMLVRDDDGWVYDIAGRHDPEALDPDDDHTHTELTPQQLDEILNRDHSWIRPALPAARGFVDAVLALAAQ